MDKNEVVKQLSEEDFLIRVRPYSDEDGEWGGEIDISVIALPNNPLNDEGYFQVMHFCKMMCATIPIMEQSEEIRNIVHEYVLNVIDNEMEVDVQLEEEAGVEKTYDGNVVHLNFNTKTGGSA
jgi:hypothetical protein